MAKRKPWRPFLTKSAGPLSLASAKALLTRASAGRLHRWPPAVRGAWNRILVRLYRLGGTSEGNRVTWFSEGDVAFANMLRAMEKGKNRVWLESYIFVPDDLGQKFLHALRDAAARGLDVRLLYDAFGSSSLDEADLRPLRDAGVRIVPFNPIWRFRRKHPVNMRDHRKILLVDDTGFAGGMNISEDYAGPNMGNGRFRDTHARLEGPCVRHLGRVFANSWREACGESLSTDTSPSPIEDGSFIQVLGSNARRRRRHIQQALRRTVMRSTNRCYLTTPYFVPPRSLVRALDVAASRGVDVRILVAGDSDVPLARRASNHLAARLLRRGIRMYELFGKTLHAKTASIDGIYGAVGSFNLDHWSYRRNLEVHVAAIDARLAAQLECHFHDDIRAAQEMTLQALRQRSVWQRLGDAVAYWLMRL